MPFPFSASDLRGGARLAADAVVGATDVVEAVHATIRRPLRRHPRTRGLARRVYWAVRRTTRGVGWALDRALEVVGRGTASRASPARDGLVAALNGAFGDTLAATGNPLATPMQVRHAGRPLPLDARLLAQAVPSPSATLLVQVHGICMHDGQWRSVDHDPGAALADGLGATSLSLRYNSGRHISENGRDLAGLLDALVAVWPCPAERIVVVGHSMGGLVARSAFHYATESGHAWPGLDAALVTLGTPHHGAPLERLGNGLDAFLESTRFTTPLARVGQIRSAGVTDLRFGNVVDEDWSGGGRFVRAPDGRQRVPLPDGVACYLVAATTGGGQAGLRDQTVGDGLVPLDSALGCHPDPSRDLGVSPDRQWVGVGMTHFDLLRRPEVTQKLLMWLSPSAA